MTLNVNRSDDAFYRYKMPKLMTKIEGKGNGIKTVITNMSEIAKALNRKPTYPTKFFGCECGAQVQMDDKSDRYIVNGVHDAQKLQELLYSFITKYVLCESCGNPETVLNVKKRGNNVLYRCKACGHRGEMSRTHRLSQYILKNPPEPDEDDVAAAGAQKAAGGEGGDEDDEANGNGDGANAAADCSMDFDDLPLPAVNDDEVKWSVDVSEGAMASRLKELTPAAEKMIVKGQLVSPGSGPHENGTNGVAAPDWLIRTEEERGERMLALIKEAKASAGVGKALSQEVMLNLYKTRNDLDLKERAVLCFIEGLLDQSDRLLEDIELYSIMFAMLTHDNERAMRYMLGGFELLIANDLEKNLDKAAKVLAALYNNDVITESVILDWFSKGPSKRYVERKTSSKIFERIKPFIEWLNTAEEETSSEESDDEEEKVNGKSLQSRSDGDSPSKVNGLSEKLGQTSLEAAKVLDNEDDSDVDIDNI